MQKQVNPMNATVANSSVAIPVNALSSKTVLIQFSTTTFTGRMKDKRMTGQIESANHITETNRAAAWKYVMKGKRLDAVLTAIARARKTWESKTAPWLDGGYRICAASRIVETKIAIEEAIRDVDQAVAELVAERDAIVMHDRKVLNGAFNESDYPSAAELRGRFGVHISLHPVPTDFRVEGIDQSLADEWQTELQRATAERAAQAKRELLERLAERLASLCDGIAKAGEKGKRFHGESLIANLCETCTEVKSANFDDDPAVNALADKVSEAVSKLDPDAIRDSSEVKETAQDTAKQTLAEVQNAMAGFVL